MQKHEKDNFLAFLFYCPSSIGKSPSSPIVLLDFSFNYRYENSKKTIPKENIKTVKVSFFFDSKTSRCCVNKSKNVLCSRDVLDVDSERFMASCVMSKNEKLVIWNVEETVGIDEISWSRKKVFFSLVETELRID